MNIFAQNKIDGAARTVGELPSAIESGIERGPVSSEPNETRETPAGSAVAEPQDYDAAKNQSGTNRWMQAWTEEGSEQNARNQHFDGGLFFYCDEHLGAR